MARCGSRGIIHWAGRAWDKVAPPQTAAEHLSQRIQALQTELDRTHQQIQTERENLRLLDLEVRALWSAHYMDELHSRRDEALQEQEATLAKLHTRAAELQDTLTATRGYLERVKQGDYGDPRGHIEHLRTPMPRQPRLNRIVEFWAALSTGLLFFLFALSIVVLPVTGWCGRRLSSGCSSSLRPRCAVVCRICCSMDTDSGGANGVLVLVVEFFWLVLLGILLALARLVLEENIRELRERG